jgi:segregation and condensation protein B
VLEPDSRLLEALLFVSPEPADLEALGRASALDGAQVEAALEALAEHYESQGHGIRLERSRAGVRLVTAPDMGAAIARFQGLDRPSRLSAAALDALAIVAYRQPITRSGVEAIRGVSSEHVLAVLQNLGLVEEIGRADSIGRPMLYGTTPAFLESAGLTSLAELPPLDDSGALSITGGLQVPDTNPDAC